MLYIESVQYTPDGRSVIKTRGERRFEIQSLRMHDGLHMAKIEFIADQLVEKGVYVNVYVNVVTLNLCTAPQSQ